MQDTYLITGSAGFIGSNLVRYLMYNHKCRIVGVDRLDTPASMHNVYMNKSHDFFIGDVKDFGFLYRVCQLFQPSKVIYLSSGQFSNVSDEVIGVENVLKCCFELDINSFVYLSSADVYDQNIDAPLIREDNPIRPSSNLGLIKSVTEALVRSFSGHKILRIPEVFGPRQTVGFTPFIIKNLNNSGSVTLYNNGISVRDLLYVEDLCSVIDTLSIAPISGTFNVSTGIDFTDNELVSMIHDQINPSKKIRIIDGGKINIQKHLDSSLLRTTIGWKPEKKFRERLKFTTTWYKNNEWVLRDESMAS